MEIEYFGHACFSLKSKSGLVVLTDPFDSKYVGLSLSKTKADIVSISHNHEDHSNLDIVAGAVKREEPFVIDSEGEYEIGGVAVTALKFYHDKNKGEDRGKNLVFVYRMDGINIAHLGDLGHGLTESQIEKLGPVDVLLVPVGNDSTLAIDEVESLTNEIAPSYVVPMHYKVDGMTSTFEKLLTLDEALDRLKWSKAGESVHKMKIDINSLPDEKQVIVMNA